MRHVIWIDIGTHEAQEFQAIFGPNYWFAFKVVKRVLRNALALSKIMNANYEKINTTSFLKIRNLIRKQKNVFKFVFVEPNPHIVSANKLYNSADIVSQVAISATSENVTFEKLYFGHGEKKSQGSSLYINKHNIKADSYQVVINFDADLFFLKLKQHFDRELQNYSIVLRLNCEGSEDSVIYAAKRQFDQNLKLVLGSIKDVGQIKGADAQSDLENFMENNALEFREFSSNISTWLSASEKLLEVMER